MVGWAAEESTTEREKRQKSSSSAPASCTPVKLAVICFALVLTGVLVSRKQQGLRGSQRAAITITRPPSPYSYSTFEPWFRKVDWENQPLVVKPSWSWFDVDGALESRPWFMNKDMKPLTSLAKKIDRFIFMESIMRSGDDSSQASMVGHLLILSLLQEALTARDGVIALDIGCGTGWLLEAFALLSNNQNSRIVGLDIKGVYLAAQLLADPDVTNAASMTPTPHVFQGDVSKDGFGMDAVQTQKLLPNNGFDVVNVGVALQGESSPEFKRASALLRDGGKLTVPICTDAVRSDAKCKADFRLYRKDHDKVVLVEGGYDVVVIVAKSHDGSGSV